MIQRKILMFCIALCVLAGGASALPVGSWFGNITVTSGDFVQTVTFGTDEKGSDGYDQGIDQLAPPPPPGPVVDVYFPVEDSLFDRLYGDIRYILSAANPERVWTLQVLSKDEDALLEWSPTTLPADIAFTLSAAGSECDMRKVASISLAKNASYIPVTIRAGYTPPAPLDANFTANRTSGNTPMTVQFNDTSTGKPTTWLWDFGDGATSTERDPVHTYTVSGVYTVSLVVRNAEGESSVVKEDAIIVRAPPPIWLGCITVTSGDFVQTVTFGTDEKGSDGYDQGIDQLAPPPPPGPVVDVYFPVEDSLFDRLYGDIRYILSAANPERVWTLQVLSKDEDALLEWSPTTLPADIAFTLSAAGSECDMRKVASISLAKNASYIPVTIRAGYTPPAPLDANFTANRTSGNTPMTVQFNDTSTGSPTAWFWDFGDNTTSTEQDPTHTYTTPGTYTVNLTVTNTAGSSSALATVTVTGAAACDLTIGGMPNPIGGVVFAREPNTIRVTNIRNSGPGASPATILEVRSDDGWAGRVDIPPIEPGKNIVIISIEDPTIRDLAGGTVTYTAEIDPDNTVIETDETNNIRSSPPKAVKYNGYKGKRYWEGGSDITTVRTYDLHGGIMHSFGDSRYVPGSSGSGEPWTNYTVTWTADDLPLPEGASVRDACLYVPYSWDDDNTVPDGVSIDFNGVRVPYKNWYTDVSNFGPYVDHHYGLLTYNVTSLFQKDTNNTALFERDRPGKISPAGFTLAVVYEDASATRKQIFINEEFDLLGADPVGYGTNETEATAYVPFSGMTIDTGNVVRADLTTFVPWGDCGDGTRPGEGNLLFNDELIQEWVWDYGEGDSTQVAVDERDVRDRLRPTGNVAGIQGTEANSPTMVAAQVFLVVEYGESVVDFTANTTAGPAPLTVQFTGTSTGNPAAWSWDFGDGSTSAVQNPAHTYAATGNYTVNLSVDGESPTCIKPNYIKVTPILFGDANGDGRVNQADTLLVLKQVVGAVKPGTIPEPGTEEFRKIDVNQNGVIDVGDALFIAQYSVGLRDVWFEVF